MVQKRIYRELYRGKNLVYFNVKVEQTDLNIATHSMLLKEALQLVRKYRKDIEKYIKRDHGFLSSLTPISCLADAPAIVRQMCNAAHRAGVGPMAAVAGAISEFVGKGLLNFSSEVIVENGGDIFMQSQSDRIAGIYAGDSPLSQKIGLKIPAEDTPMGICTSSGKIGHSLSFGKADAVVILSKDTALADAAATAVGNIVISAGDIQKGINFAKRIEGVLGVVVIVEDKLGAWGDIQLVRL
ncbi:MAG: UPF0280 family protein [Clostridiales bacterium]|jgi:ApbE superfamily uncharacterized protein (UPF0280 family)|nr:UPF0280 family protein [Clostridiales bacterium]